MIEDKEFERLVGRVRLKQEQKEMFVAITKKILSGLFLGTLFAVAMTNPTALHRLVIAYLKDKEKLNDTDAEIMYEKLRKDRYLELYKKKDKYGIKITEKGRRCLVEYNIDTIKIHKIPWDGKWRIVVYDIPEKHRHARFVLRDKLKQIGFIKLQKSVWICPYECQNEIDFICEVYSVSQYVNYIITEKIDADQALRTKFSL
ncbi:MAG: CRISPR-associated endonuclease Cas2 [bacterium]